MEYRDQRSASQFPLLVPQFQCQRDGGVVLGRDRFRNVADANGRWDDVEDEEGREYATEAGGRHGLGSLPFNALANLQRYPDRQTQAQHGRARLSLDPRPLTFQSRSGLGEMGIDGHSRGYDGYGEMQDMQVPREHSLQSRLGRFAYFPDQSLEPSSDAQYGLPSSPTVKAGQRRHEQSSRPSIERVSREHFFGNEDQYMEQENDYPSSRYLRVSSAQSQSFVQEEDFHPTQQIPLGYSSTRQSRQARPAPRAMALPHAPPMCQGIQLVPVSTLPDRLRTVFPYPVFNAVQSKCFNRVFQTDDNFVLASPTGSGKTVILELAVCRAVAINATGQYKIVYQAPTKALCSERLRDWDTKFNPLGLRCAELTGDSDNMDLRNVQSANIIITTPEKWDSVTRKWKDNEKLMKMIKVFLIDEVHILKEDRGAVLETIVSRMKSIGTDVRFVALSATVPNFHDVASWLGKTSTDSDEPAASERFGEEFRPVKLQKFVCGYAYASSNDFGFDRVLNSKIPEVIVKYSKGKPMMVFCMTRNSCISTAKLIAEWWMSKSVSDRFWAPPRKQIPVLNKDLRDIIASGVAFHHAGLELDDRTQVEKGFLGHDIHIICCTSTLAVGVNLPFHTVIIKNTVTFTSEGMQEYSDLEMMQMVGRAGRPQFDDSAVAVIMTRQTKVRRYESMVTGQDLLESKLHLNLIDHMNAEIGLGTIRDLASARKWLTGTFLYVRLQQNPNHYKLAGATNGQSVEEQVDEICSRDVALLQQHSLVSDQECFQCTEFGHAMARYYVHFDTMKIIMGIQFKASPSEILSAIAQASEFSQIRFRSGEKSVYRMINKSSSIRFSIPVNLDLPAHKVSLIIQSVLGSADISWDGESGKYRSQYLTETQIVFKNVSSLIRCIIDCQLYVGDFFSIHSALMLERSLGAKAWDESPLQMKQIEGIGVVAVRKLVNARIKSMEDLDSCDARRIEALLGRNPPFGMQILDKVKDFPRLRVSLHIQTSSTKKCLEGVKLHVRVDIGFINEKLPLRFAGRPVYVSLLAGTSDGRKMHFARISGQKLGRGQSLSFPALLTSPDQSITCDVMCDSIAGSLRSATAKPQLPPAMFATSDLSGIDTPQKPNTSKRRSESFKPARKPSMTSEDFGDDGINDDEMMEVTSTDRSFVHIDNFANPADTALRKNTTKTKSGKDKTQSRVFEAIADQDGHEPVQLANGKWACNHKCKDKNACKHLCCREGLDKPPKKPAASKRTSLHETTSHKPPARQPKDTQTKLRLTPSKRGIASEVEELDLTQNQKKQKTAVATQTKDYASLHHLHQTIQRRDPPPSLTSVMHKKPAYCYSQGGEYSLSFMPQSDERYSVASSDYGDIPFDELASRMDFPAVSRTQQGSAQPIQDYQMRRSHPSIENKPTTPCDSENYGDDDSLLGDALVGLADSQSLRNVEKLADDSMWPFDTVSDVGLVTDLQVQDIFEDIDFSRYDDSTGIMSEEDDMYADTIVSSDCEATKCNQSFHHNETSPKVACETMSLAETKPEDTLVKDPARLDPDTQQHTKLSNQASDNECDVLDLLDEHSEQPKTLVPDAFKDLEPWLFQEFGDIVMLVDD